MCQAIKNELNRKSLNLCFIDPTDCSVPFILIKEIKETLPNVDFIINLASGTDFNRNIGNVILNDNQNLKLKYFYIDFIRSHVCHPGGAGPSNYRGYSRPSAQR